MPTRFNVRPKSRYGVLPIQSGYDPSSCAGDVVVPACGIEDVDRALFNLFDKEISINVFTENDKTSKVPVIFAAREKWDMIKRSNGVQDKNGSLILPLITIVREDVVQSISEDIAGRGANQHVGELIVHRQLSPHDRGYQNIKNKLNINNQKNVSSTTPKGTANGQPFTLSNIGELSQDPTIEEGGFLISDVRDNIIETFTIPTPQKVTIKYRMTLWSQFQQQSNQMIETCVSSYLPQTRGWQIVTTEGYRFNAFVTSDEFASKGNASDMSREERTIKHEFSVEVQCFILTSDAPGLPVHVKRYVSAPNVSFNIAAGGAEDSISSSTVIEPFLGSDDPTLPLSTKKRPSRRDARKTGHGRVFPARNNISEDDPRIETIRPGTRLGRWSKKSTINGPKYVRIKSTSPGGETVTVGDVNLSGISVNIVDE